MAVCVEDEAKLWNLGTAVTDPGTEVIDLILILPTEKEAGLLGLTV